ncbi:hypothetical protein RHSIM_Rhsim08G0043900 [Rhododendron simsii]|uniref:Uncharacterized protein n=1 Tax=Rhododendron simsii TaxID=118357 RepID=A0A834LGB4_RHOSS|nr:hypothetical protein RHSIM_Rhsim08G0043900 [Rhododendron simsii]
MGACASIHKDPESNMKFRLSVGSKTENLVIPSPVKDKPTVNGNFPIADGGLKSQWSTSQPPPTVRDIADGISRWSSSANSESLNAGGPEYLMDDQLQKFISFCDSAGKIEYKFLCSKEETFFDSQPWLDSDCDDDFVSVNGDFTPSRGSTPVHHGFSAGPPQLDKAHFDAKTPGSKPPPKRLSELFRESFQKNKEVGEQNIISNQNGVNGKTEAKSPKFGLPPRSANSTPFASGANSLCSTERTPTIGDYVIEKEEPMGSMRCCIPRVLSSRSFSGRKTPPRSIG